MATVVPRISSYVRYPHRSDNNSFNLTSPRTMEPSLHTPGSICLLIGHAYESSPSSSEHERQFVQQAFPTISSIRTYRQYHIATTVLQDCRMPLDAERTPRKRKIRQYTELGACAHRHLKCNSSYSSWQGTARESRCVSEVIKVYECDRKLSASVARRWRFRRRLSD